MTVQKNNPNQNDSCNGKAMCKAVGFGVLIGVQLFLALMSSRELGLHHHAETTFEEPPPSFVEHSDEPLNILVLYPDDWRHDAIGDVRPGVVFTPFLSELAKKGIRFTNNFVTTSICWISRATLFSGQYATQHASHRLGCPRFTAPHNWNGSWPYILQKIGGYFVGHVGKWQYTNRADLLFNWSSLHEGRHWYGELHAADRAADDAIRFLRERPQGPNFALTVAFYPPKPIGDSSEPGAQWEPHPRHVKPYENHTFVPPYNFTEAFDLLPTFLKTGYGQHRYETRYQTNEMYQASLRNYLALVSHVDEASSRIIAELERQGVLNKTMIIVTADNGMMMGSHGLAGKWHPFEDSIRVPLIIYDPRLPLSKAGIVEDSTTLNIDLASTIVKAANITPDPRMQGRDIADLYLENGATHSSNSSSSWRNDFFYEFTLGEFPSSTALRTERYKYIHWPRSGMEQLFDLHDDQNELRDLLVANETDYTTVLLKLRARHNELRDIYIEPDKPKEICNRDNIL